MTINKIISMFVGFVFCLMQTLPAFALPTGQSVQAGSAVFNQAGNVLNINQQSDKLIANYQSFSIAANEAVNFIQPSSSSVALNRVVGADPSDIFGQLTANGKIFLINPNGVLFGPSARVDTGGLVASTLDISNDDFLAGKYTFTNSGNSSSVINQGSIESPGSFVALLGRHVANSGTIEAGLGSVALAAGDQITLSLDPLGLISVAIDEPLRTSILADDAVDNSGTINAEGGRVILTAQSLNSMLKNSVNNSGIITARSLVNRDGEIYLLGDKDQGSVVNTGVLDTSAAQKNADGGSVELSGALLDLAGGTILTNKDGQGKNGSILLDPVNFTIDDTWASFFANQSGSDITVQADQDVNFQITGLLLDLVNLNTETFFVHAGGNIDQNGVTVVTGGGNVNFLSDTGNISLSAPIETNGGNVDIEATMGNVTHTNLANILTSGGYFRGYAGGDYTINNGAVINTGDGVMDIYAGNNLVLGTPGNSDAITYTWQYISGSRVYSFMEFGYYYYVGSQIVLVPIVDGTDIGKDGTSPLSASGSIVDMNGFGLYVKFDRGNSGDFNPIDTSGTDHWTYYTDPALNESGFDHVIISGNDYAWEDTYNLGDRDFNDAIFNFSLVQSPLTQGVDLSSNTNIFLTANQGSITQAGGTIHADNLALDSNTGTSGTAANGGLITDVNNLSAVNKGSGDIRVSNDTTLNITDQSSLTGLNNGVSGANGISNQAPGGIINIASGGNLSIDAPISSSGDIVLQADDDISHSSNGVITIDNGTPVIGPPTNVQSTSHQDNVWSNDSNIVVTWQLPDMPKGNGTFTATAGGAYTMAPGSKIITDNGDATITANGDIGLSLVDAGNAPVTITSNHGSILDNDPANAPTNNNVIGSTINLSAPDGLVGQPVPGGQIYEGHPFSFSWLFDESPSTTVDNTPDPYTTTLQSNGTWVFSTSYPNAPDSNGWFFHVATEDVSDHLSSTTVTSGPYLIDTVAPVITAGTPQGTPGPDGTFLSEVTVPFTATDDRSGFAPSGALFTNLPSQTTTGIGNGLTVTSGTISDRAGNIAVPVIAGPFDVTAPGFPTIPNGPIIKLSNIEANDLDNIVNLYRVYYEILKPSQFLSFEPALKIGLYAYHPLTPTENKTGEINLDVGAYQFIENNIELKNKKPVILKE